MDDKQLVSFINDMMRTDLDCIDCTEVNDVLARYVDLEVAGSALEDVSPEMAEHIKACPPCADMHATLLEVARLESDGRLTDTEALWADVAELVDRRNARRAGGPWWRSLGFGAWAGGLAGVAAVTLLFLGWRSANRNVEQANEFIASSRATMAAMEAKLDEVSIGLEVAQASAEAAQAAAEEERKAVDMIAELSRERMIEREDGSWTRLFFDPDKPGAVVLVGALPALGENQYLECWLKRAADGAMMSAGTMQPGSPEGTQHWMIEADTPIRDFSLFVITVEPQSQPLFEVSLTQDS